MYRVFIKTRKESGVESKTTHRAGDIRIIRIDRHEIYTAIDLSDMSLKQLREECASRGLSKKGNAKIECRRMLQETGLSGVTIADWNQLFRTGSEESKFGAVTLLQNEPRLSEELASLLVIQFAIESGKGGSELSSAISHVLTCTGVPALRALVEHLDHPNEKVRQATRDACRDIEDVSMHHHVVAALVKGMAERPAYDQQRCANLIGRFKLRPALCDPREVGLKLAHALLPTLDALSGGGGGTPSADEPPLEPVFSQPRAEAGLLPGGLHYLNITVPKVQ
mgnify:CR=1 FL=1